MHANGGKYAINLPTGLSVGSNTVLSQNMMTVDFSVNRKAIMEYGEDGEVKTYSYNTLSSSERSVSSGSKDVSDRAVSYGTDRFGNINSVVGDDGNGEANVGDSVYTHGLLTRVKSGSADIKSGTVDGAINGLIDGAIDGVMWGGIFAGGAQILSGGFKIAAKLGVKTGIKGGIKISKHVKILSPNHLKHYEG